MPYDLEIPGWHWLCLCHQSRIKQASPAITGVYPQKGTLPLAEIFLIEISPALRWRPGWAGLGSPAFSSGSGQSGGQALGPGPCPNPQPMGWTAPALEMTRPSRELAAPGWHASKQGPADRSRRWGPGCCGSPVRVGAATAIFASLGPPEDPLEDLLLGSSPFFQRSSGPQVAWLLCRHPSSALPLDPVPPRPAPGARLQRRKFADTVEFINFLTLWCSLWGAQAMPYGPGRRIRLFRWPCQPLPRV